jgi:hypothetical protein
MIGGEEPARVADGVKCDALGDCRAGVPAGGNALGAKPYG